MDILELKIPPVVVLILALVGVHYSPVIVPFISNDHYIPDWQANLASLCFITGVLIAVAGVVTFKLAKTTSNPISIENTSALVTHGIYRLTRNPMYLGMLMIILAFIIKTGHIAGLVFAVGFVFYMTRFQIKPEERMLTKIFADQYTDYMKRTRPWI